MTRLPFLRFVSFLGLATALLLMSGCRTAAPVESPPAPVREAPTNADLRRAAMLSVYFYSLYTSSDWLPEELRPIDLLDAARILKRGEGPYAESRRRRAIANLAAPGLDDPKRREALAILGAPIREIEELLADLVPPPAPSRNLRPSPTAGGAPPCGVVSAIADLATIDHVIVPAILDLLEQKLGLAIPGCAGKISVIDTDHDWVTMKSTVTVGGWVERDFSVVCEKMDPQHWDECSDFFGQTYIAQKTGAKYAIQSDYSVKADPSPPPLCTAYDREIFEHFDVAFDLPGTSGGLVLAWYKQLLSIDSEKLSPGTGHRYGYHLYQAIRSQVGLHQDDGGIDTNEGEVKLEWDAAENRTKLELTKTVRFSDRPWIDLALNLLAPVTLRAMTGELHEMACCNK